MSPADRKAAEDLFGFNKARNKVRDAKALREKKRKAKTPVNRKNKRVR